LRGGETKENLQRDHDQFDRSGRESGAFPLCQIFADQRQADIGWVQVQSRRGKLVFSARDAGSGVDPGSIVATVDGGRAKATLADGLLTLRAQPGRHRVHLVVADYQEAKNMEDVAPILPNTTTVDMTVQVLRAKRS